MARIETELRSVRLKNAIENYLIPLFGPYQVCSLRCLWCPDSDEAEKEIWARRRMLEDIIISNTDVVAVVSCITFIPIGKKHSRAKGKKESLPKPLPDPFSESSGTEEESDEIRSAQRCRPSRKPEVWERVATEYKPGVAFWIAYNMPESSAKQFQMQISRALLESGVDVTECNAIVPRGLYLSTLLIYIFLK